MEKSCCCWGLLALVIGTILVIIIQDQVSVSSQGPEREGRSFRRRRMRRMRKEQEKKELKVGKNQKKKSGKKKKKVQKWIQVTEDITDSENSVEEL